MGQVGIRHARQQGKVARSRCTSGWSSGSSKRIILPRQCGASHTHCSSAGRCFLLRLDAAKTAPTRCAVPPSRSPSARDADIRKASTSSTRKGILTAPPLPSEIRVWPSSSRPANAVRSRLPRRMTRRTILPVPMSFPGRVRVGFRSDGGTATPLGRLVALTSLVSPVMTGAGGAELVSASMRDNDEPAMLQS